jgi:RNA recognition motif-containing protein
MANKTLYVGNLPYSATESQLNTYFANYGGTNARIMEGRGFGFVDVDSDKLDTAINEKNNVQMDGRTLTVNEAKPRTENRGGGGSYGGGRSSGSGGYRSGGRY